MGWALALLWLGALLTAPSTTTAVEPDGLPSELGCPACHTDLDVATDVTTKAPPLADAGSRYQTAYLFDYLRAPRTIRRHIGATRMPDFHLADDEALALTMFLAEQTQSPSATPALPQGLDEEVGERERIDSEEEFVELAREQSCLACHTREGDGGVLGPELADVGARLRPEWMRRFLLSPSAWGVEDGVMPPLFVRESEDGVARPIQPDSVARLRRIVEYLARSGSSERRRMEAAYAEARTLHPAVTAGDGRRVFDALQCRACHRFGDAKVIEPAPGLRREKERVQSNWLHAYLSHPWPVRPFGTRPGSGARMPDFALTTAEVERLADALGASDGVAGSESVPPLTAYQQQKARLLLERRLACLGCHRLDGVGGRIGPDLTNAATRLRPSFLRTMIADPGKAAPHSTMPRLPLDEATRALVSGYLIQARAPVATEHLSLIENDTIPLPEGPSAARDYARYCAPCHGEGGRADGFNAAFLPTRPTAHADPAVLALRADDTLFDGIHSGGAILDRSHLMPAWGETLSAERIGGLVEYMRTLCRCKGPSWSTNGTKDTRERPPRAAPTKTVALAMHAEPTFDDFVGAEACAECHAGEYEAWRGSTHGRAGGAPGEVEIIAAFDGKPRRFRDGAVRPIRTRDGRYLFRVRQDGQPTRELEVTAAVGGGHMAGGGTQTFFAQMPDGSVRMLPFDFHRGQNTWFVQRRRDTRWTPIGPHIGLDELEHWPPHRALGTAAHLSNCENCHGSQIQVDFDPTTSTWETRWKTLRIGCESCHGPGRTHLEWAKSPDRDERADLGIAPLAVLGKGDSVEICLRCHANKQVLEANYLPGADIDAHFSLKLPMLAQGAYLADGRVAGFGYQQNHLFSDCFVEGSMVCTHCHDPHSQTYRDVNGRALEGRFDDAQCTGCHASKARDVSAHTHHPADSPGSRCVACHMPYLQHQAIGNEIVFARSDHTIPIPRPVFDESLGIENACTKCHADRSTTELQGEVERWWAPLKPHHPMIERILEARGVSEPDAAARLLLAPDEPHTIAQMAGLSEFVRSHVRADTPLRGEATERLVALAQVEDVDVAAVAIAALHIAASTDSRVATLRAAARGRADPRAEAIRRRHRYALIDLQRLRAREGDAEEAERLRRKRNELTAAGE